MKILNQGFDHVEFALNDVSKHAEMYERMGFEIIGSAETIEGKTTLLAQGLLRLKLTVPKKKSLNHDFLEKHGEGITVLALSVDDATKAYDEAVTKGAKSAVEPQTFETEKGRVVHAQIYTPEDVRYAFIERTVFGAGQAPDRDVPALFDNDLVASRLQSPAPWNIQFIDHLTNNVNIGEMKKWVEWYQNIFDFQVVRHFDISTGRTGLTSDVVQSKCGKITVPINEATEPESQVQEFVERFNGAGVQHLAFLTTDIVKTLGHLRKEKMKFLSIPHTYYEKVPSRVKEFSEDLNELEKLQILLDGEGGGYLLQIFSEEILGPFFFEFIQRKGNQGFGEGNFSALFEAIELDQVRRGVL